MTYPPLIDRAPVFVWAAVVVIAAVCMLILLIREADRRRGLKE